MRNVLISVGFVIGFWFGWYMAINYVIHTIERKQNVMPVQDWSRMRDLSVQLNDSKFLFF
jgi:hypothetical protein